MVFKKLILPLAVAALMAGCGDDGDVESEAAFDALGATAEVGFLPLDQYGYDDFNLPEDVLYWETRANAPLAAGIPVTLRYEVLFFYAQERLAAEIEDNLGLLAEVDSTVGFANLCALEYCPVYIAGLNEAGGAFLVTTQIQLAQFFGEIDTSAELAYWLWAEEFNPLSYDEVDGGWNVTAERVERCETRQQFELFVDTNGVITVTEAGEVIEDDRCEDDEDTFNETFDDPELREPILGGSTDFDQPSLTPGFGEPDVLDTPVNDPFQGGTAFDQPEFGEFAQDSPFIGESPLSQPTFGQPTFDGGLDAPSINDSPLNQPAFDAPLFNGSSFD